MKCKLCGNVSEKIFSHKILGKHDAAYFQCRFCKFIQTEDPFWLEEAYQHSINIEDTGLIDRNILFAKRTATVLYTLFDKAGTYLDYGGGYGMFVRLMRDLGFNFYWQDPFTENLFARGFEFDEKRYGRCELITTFECFEHFRRPIEELENMFRLSDSILFSTEIFTSSSPPTEDWQFYGFSHGQHIALYSLDSLRYLAQRYQRNFYTYGNTFHLFTKKRIPNKFFKLLLMISVLGVPSLIRFSLGSKVLSDSQFARYLREK